jgi:predicted Zn-dependent peptidase
MIHDIEKFIADASPTVGSMSQHRLSCGLNVVVVQNKAMRSFSASIGVIVGRWDEEASVAGVSHFLEHAVFLGTKKFRSTRKIDNLLLSLGGPFNGETGDESTAFSLSGTVDKMPLGVELLSQLVFFPLLIDGDAFENERGVILAEVDETNDANGNTFDEEDLGTIHVLSGVRKGGGIMGSRSSVLKMRPSDLKAHHSTYYYPENAVLILSSPQRPGVVIKMLEKVFPDSLKTGREPNTSKFGVSKIFKTPRRVMSSLLNMNSVTLEIYIKFLLRGTGVDKNGLALDILRMVLFHGESSYFFGAAREAGLVYSLGGGIAFSDDHTHFDISTIVRPSNLKKLMLCLTKAVEGIFENGLDKKRFELARNCLRYAHDKNSLSPDQYLETMLEATISRGAVMTPKEALEEMETITIEDVQNELFKLLNSKRISVLVYGSRLKDEYRKIILRTLRKLKAISKSGKAMKKSKSKK